MTIASSRTVGQLLAAIDAGESAHFVFFRGHRASKDGCVTKTCFSQWHEAPFSVESVDCGSAEHYMMGSAADDPDALHSARWRGPNLPGFALMEVRNQLSRHR